MTFCVELDVSRLPIRAMLLGDVMSKCLRGISHRRLYTEITISGGRYDVRVRTSTSWCPVLRAAR